jgi:hypothetical protein
MKTLKKLLMVVVLVVTASALASNKKPVHFEKAVEEIVAILGKPSFEVTKQDLVAQFVITINSDNEIVVLSVDTNKQEVEQFIKSRLNYKKVSSTELKKGRVYKVPLRVKGTL